MAKTEAPESSSYSKGSILEAGEGNPFEEYEMQFNIEPDDLRGKTVLDLGSGLKDLFAKGLRAMVPARVVSLSPDFQDEEIAGETRAASPEGNLVAGVGQNLPFADESFDGIYVLHVNEHIRKRGIFVSILSEIARTLKRGGVAKIGPYSDIPNYSYPFRDFSESPDITAPLDNYNIFLEREDASPRLPRGKVKDDHANAFWVWLYSIVLRKPFD